MRNIFHIVAAIKQLTRDGLQSAAGNTLISHYIPDFGQTNQYTRTVFIAQSPLHIEFREQFIIDARSFFHLFGKLINKIFFFHISVFLWLLLLFDSSYNLFCKDRSRERNSSRHKASQIVCGTSIEKTLLQGMLDKRCRLDRKSV